MWLNPLKGAHLTLGQLDKTLPVDLSNVATTKNDKIERGSIVFISTSQSTTGTPRFQLYTSTQAGMANAVPYIALMSVKDFQAGMAGNVGQAPEVDDDLIDKGIAATGDTKTWLETPPQGAESIVGVGAAKGPRITAISLLQPAEFQTTAYDHSVNDYYVGRPLTVNNDGVLTAWSTGKNIVGYVTAIPHTRWINDLGASRDGARISGGNAKVIEFSTAWIPVAASAASGNNAGTVGMLSLKGVKVDAKADAPAPAAGAKVDAKDSAPAGAKVDNTKTK